MRQSKTLIGALTVGGLLLFASPEAAAVAETRRLVAPADFETNNNSTSAMSFGAWLATGTAKLRLTLHNRENEIYTKISFVNVYTRGNVLMSSCTVREHHRDGSGSNHPFDQTNAGDGYLVITRAADINSISTVDFPEVECLLQAGDTIEGGLYGFQ
jgi:hypothetical protein